jgi:hypothetical protein
MEIDGILKREGCEIDIVNSVTCHGLVDETVPARRQVDPRQVTVDIMNVKLPSKDL